MHYTKHLLLLLICLDNLKYKYMFLVIEGLDGAGKSTQVKMLRERAKSMGIESEYLHFPRFTSPYYGDMIARFLRGDLGTLESVDPYIVAMLYAGDRLDASKLIESWLAEDKLVIVDRYVYSNIAYQCAKLHSVEEQDKLRDWIFGLEYNHNNIIKPDLSLFLDVPLRFTEKSLSTQREGDDRDYLKGGADIHEASMSFQEKVRESYLSQQPLDDKFKVVDCSDDDGNMAPADVIFERIISHISL